MVINIHCNISADGRASGGDPDSFGIWTTVEPRGFSYASGLRQRPDIIFHTPKPITTDVTVVNTSGDVGLAAADAAKLKIAIHAPRADHCANIQLPHRLQTRAG